MATDGLAPLAEDRAAAVLGAPTGTAPAATAGRSASRRRAGLVGQYALLVVLAVLVLAPVALTVIQALSPPFSYVDAGKPLHPVDVDWKDRTWFSGGAVSVVVRTLLVALALAWVQLRAAGGGVRRPGPLADARRLGAVAAGVVAIVLVTGPIFDSLVHRTGTTAAWVVAAIALVAATQLLGLAEPGRALWRSGLLAGLTGVAMVAATVVLVGGAVWTDAWNRGDDLGPAMLRSLVVTVMITACQVVTAVLAAYAFAFLRFPGRALLFAFFMGSLLLPIEVTLLANVQTVRELEWINSNQALVLPFAATALGTFLIRQGFLGLPSEIRDATRLDGYGHMAFLWRFAVPLVRPVVASFTVISALSAWNQYLWPQAVIDQTASQTTQIRLHTVVRTDVADANVSIAAALIVALPVLALLVAFQRQMIRGLTAGAVKG